MIILELPGGKAGETFRSVARGSLEPGNLCGPRLCFLLLMKDDLKKLRCVHPASDPHHHREGGGATENKPRKGPLAQGAQDHLLLGRADLSLVGMEVLISAVAGDLVSRFISFVAQNYGTQTCEEEDRRRLERILLRMHMVVEEAEGRHITNQGMFLQLKTLIEGVHLGYYMLDRLKFQSLGEESVEDDDMSHWSQSLAVSTFNSAKRLRFAVAASIMKNAPVAFGTRITTNLKSVLESLEATTADMRDFVVLLGSCRRLPRQPYCMYLYMDKCMFGRHVQKEQLINFLLCDDSRPDCTHISILPIIGPHRIGKKTLVQHACKDERVCNRFSHMFFFKGDDLRSGVFKMNSNVASGKYLFVVDFIFDVDEAAWTNFQSYLQKLPDAGIKIVVTGRAERVANLGTAQPIRLKSLSQEEYWYYFKALAFGSMDPEFLMSTRNWHLWACN